MQGEGAAGELQGTVQGIRSKDGHTVKENRLQSKGPATEGSQTEPVGLGEWGEKGSGQVVGSLFQAKSAAFC